MTLDLGEGADLLASAKLSGESILPNTAKAGHGRIQHDLETLSSDYAEVEAQVESAETNLQQCLKHWNDFDAAQERFSQWLTASGQRLKKEVELKADLPQKEQALLEQKVGSSSSSSGTFAYQISICITQSRHYII